MLRPPTFVASPELPTKAYPLAVASGDLNGDRQPDLAVANADTSFLSVFLGTGNGGFAPAVHTHMHDYPKSIGIADFNGDGRTDLAVADRNRFGHTVEVLLGRGNGTFERPVVYRAGAFPNSIAVGDFNRDGRPDLVSANGSASANDVSVLLGRGNGRFGPPHHYRVHRFPYGTTGVIGVHDLNGDHRLDLAVTNSVSNDVSVLLGRGDGTFRRRVNYRTSVGPRSVAIADLNGDHHPDLAVANYYSGKISVLLGRGDGTFRRRANYEAGDDPAVIGVGDVNGDKRPDLAVATLAPTDVSVLLGRGGGKFSRPISVGPAHHGGSLVLADLDRDGRLDVAATNSAVNTLSVLINRTAFRSTRHLSGAP